MNEFLQSTAVIDWQHPEVLLRAQSLASGCEGPVEIAQRCFEWVRDVIKHSLDHGLQPVTCSASEVLMVGSGFCYAKSHLLAALLRANGIPAALCYQRLACNDDGSQFCLHGLNAIHLPDIGWYRVDARGNRADVDAQFAPPVERLAFNPSLLGEIDVPGRFAEPLLKVVAALESHSAVSELKDHLPDLSAASSVEHL